VYPIRYNSIVFGREIRLLEISPGRIPFERWYESLRDMRTRQRVLALITRLSDPNYCNFKSVGHGVQELRIDYGPGYRVYFAQRGSRIVVLLGGGDKSTQKEDIYSAINLWKEYKHAFGQYRRKLFS